MSTTPTTYTILIAEDNVSELKLLDIAMKESGLKELLTIETAYNGEEAIDALSASIEKHRYDLILLDLNMPRVPGKDVLSHLRKTIALYRPVVIILSNSDRHEDIQDCYQLGADAYMQKPPEFAELIAFCEVIRKSIEATQSISLDYIRPNYELSAY